MNPAFEARVKALFHKAPPVLPSDWPEELWAEHGAVVLREVVARRQMAATRRAGWCRKCGQWRPYYAEQPDCPHCGAASETEAAIGSAWVAVARRSAPRSTRRATVHAKTLEKWVRHGENAFQREAGELLCRPDRRVDLDALFVTTEAVTCWACRSKLKKHMEVRDGQ